MNQFNFNPYMYEEIKRQHEELIKEAALLRKIKNEQFSEHYESKNRFNLFALLGRELSRIGFSLEVRYGSQPEARPILNGQGTTGDCA